MAVEGEGRAISAVNLKLPRFWPADPDVWFAPIQHPWHNGPEAKHWVESFVSVYQAKDVTPYMHAFAIHVPEFMALHGDVVAFTQQGLEKLNDITTQHFQRASNYRDYEALKQILEKWNRIEALEDNGYSRKIRCQTCSICKKVGHNRQSCTVLQPLDTNL